MVFSAIEDAIHTWVTNASKLAGNQVYFTHQNGPQPSDRPFISITIGESIRSIGAVDEMTRDTDLTRPAGSEIQQTVTGQRDMTCLIQAFAEGVVERPLPQLPFTLPSIGSRTAVALMLDIQVALGLESVRSGLNAVGLSPYNIGRVRRLDALIETHFEGRAILDLNFYMSDQVIEQVGYVKEIQGTGTFIDGAITVPVPVDVIGS